MPAFTSSTSTARRKRALRGTLAAAATVAVLSLGACGNDNQGDRGASAKPANSAGGSVRSGEAPVEIVNFEFEPPTIRVEPGTTVLWTNGDTAVHSVKDTSPMATPVSPDLGKGDTFRITYDKPGTYSYLCGIHQYMTGVVDVVG